MSEQRQFEIQTVIFPKKHWTLATAKAWAKDHKFRTDKVDETDVSFRFRQREPGLFARLRTICINPGTDTPPGDDRCRVKAVGGPLKKSKEMETSMPQGRVKVQASLPVTIRQVDPENRMIEFLASDETVDRYGTVISAGGWNLANFRKNPVFLFGHNYRDPAAVIGRVLKTEKDADKGELSIQVLFAEKEVNPLAEMVFQMYTHKPPFLNAVSVGFIPLKHEEIAEDEQEKGKQSGPKRRARLRFLQQELLEVSAVIVPANPNALAKGIDQSWGELGVLLGSLGMDPVLAMTAQTALADGDERAALCERMVCWLDKNGLVCEPETPYIFVDEFVERAAGERVPGRVVKPLPSHPPTETCPSCDPGLVAALEQAALGPEDEADERPAEERAGAVLNARNRTALKQAQTLIQQVLDSAEKPSEGEEEGAHGDKKKKPKKKEDDYAGILLETEPDAEADRDSGLGQAIADLAEQVEHALHLLEQLYEELVLRKLDEEEPEPSPEAEEEPASESVARLDAVLARVSGGSVGTDSRITNALEAVSAGLARLERQLSAKGPVGVGRS